MKWGYSLRELRRRPLRTALTLAGITIGVAALLSLSVTVETTRHAYADMYTTLAGRATLEVVPVGDDGVDPALAETIGRIAGVRVAAPVVQAPAVLLGPRGRIVVLVVGVDPERDAAVRDHAVREGTFVTAGREAAALDAAFAEANGLGVGDAARIVTRTGGGAVPVCGLLEPGPASAFNAGAVVFLPLDVARSRFGLGATVNAVQLVLDDDASRDHVRAAVQAALPEGLLCRAPAAQAASVQDAMSSTPQALQTFSLMSLVAGGFIILNTFLMNLAERRRQLALIRALGATRRQVRRWLLREAAVLGVLGTVLGVPLGWAMSYGMLGGMGELLGSRLSTPRPGIWPFVAAVVLGPGMALAATWVPARRAGREPPLRGINLDREDAPEAVQRWPLYAGLFFVAVTGVVAVVLVGGLLDPRRNIEILAPGMVCFMLAGILLMPYVLGPVMAGLVRVLGPVLGLEGRMAARHLERRRIRTALTSGVIFMAVAISIAFGNQIRSNLRDMDRWYDETIVGDWFLRGVMPGAAAFAVPSVRESLEAEISALDGVGSVRKVRFFPTRVSGQAVIVLATSILPGDTVPLDLEVGRLRDVVEGMRAGGVVLGTTLAQRFGVEPGGTIDLETREGRKRVRVVGTCTEYTSGGMCLYAEWETARRLFALRGVDVFSVTAARDAPTDLGDRLAALAGANGLLFQSNAELKATIDRMVDEVIGFMWTVLLLVFVVASLGTVNTLTMNVIEQTREIGVLRAVAMTRRQVGRLVRWQAVLLGLASLVPGLGLGVAATVLLHFSNHSMTGIPVAFRLDPVVFVVCCVLAPATTVLASVLPAHRAARMPVFEALHHE